jgi:putative FmdB family regulatory protein
MPIYEYVCDSCKYNFEIEQSMQDEILSECPKCKNKIRRVFSLSPIIFKGSGFYSTDTRKTEGKEKSSVSS